MKSKARFFSFIVLVFFIQIIIVSVAAAATRIMPLGDSITRGTNGGTPPEEMVGYRQTLYLDLIDEGYDVDFVGGEEAGIDALPLFDIEHEGHGGWQAAAIRDNIYDMNLDFLSNNPADVILLHIGTNDISNDRPTDDIVDEVEEILVKIDQYESDIGKDVPVLLALIILRGDSRSPQTILFNNAVRTMAELRIAGGDNIVIVNMQNALVYPGDLVDDVHPNVSGYDKMADVWFSELVQILPDPDPDPDPPNNSSNSNSDSGCFISTVTYGLLIESHATVPKEFRSPFKFTNILARNFLDFYHTVLRYFSTCAVDGTH